MKKYMIIYIKEPISKKSIGKLADVTYKTNSPKEAIKKFHKYHPRKHIKHIYKV